MRLVSDVNLRRASLKLGSGTSLTKERFSCFSLRWFAMSNMVSVKSLCQIPCRVKSVTFFKYFGNLIGVGEPFSVPSSKVN